MLDCALLEKREEEHFTKIISNNHYIYVKRLYFKNLLALTRVNIKSGVGDNKRRAT